MTVRRIQLVIALAFGLLACKAGSPAPQPDAGARVAPPVTKMGAGVRAGPATDGTLQDLAAQLPPALGQSTKAGSLAVTIASDQGSIGTVSLDTSALATSANQTTGNTSLSTIATNTTGVATAAAQATQLTALNMLTQPRTTTTVTPSDSTDLTGLCNKGMWVGVAGDVAIKLAGDSAAATLKNMASGMYGPGNVIRVMATNTTATNIVCFGGTG